MLEDKFILNDVFFRNSITTPNSTLVGQGNDNVFVIQSNGLTHVVTGIGYNVLQDTNTQSTVKLDLTTGSQTWIDDFYYDLDTAQLQISGSSNAHLYFELDQISSWLQDSVLLREGSDLVIAGISNSHQLRFTDWFAEFASHNVTFKSDQVYVRDGYNGWFWYGHYENKYSSLQKWVDQFATLNGGVIENGSSIQISTLGWNVAEVGNSAWSNYQPLDYSNWMWQAPLTRVMFTAGMGNVVASDYGAIVFDSSFTPDDIHYLKSGNDLVISSVSGSDSLRLQDWYLYDNPVSSAPEAWFSDSLYAYQDLSHFGITLIGTDHTDQLIAPDNYGWILQGLAGDDVLQGNTGADTLDGGSGNDTLLGGAGSDTYYFGIGSGHDVLSDQTLVDSGDINTVYIQDLLPEDVIINSDDNHHIILSIHNTTDKLSIQWDSQAGYLIQQVVFNDGTVWDSALLESMAVPLNTAPVLLQPIADQKGIETQAFNFQIPANTFYDTDIGDSLSYTVTLADGSPLPAWLSFNAATHTFSGTPSLTDAGQLFLMVTATDQGGLSINNAFKLNIANLITGTAYNDNLTGTQGDDYISTGTGNDTVNAGDGNDTLIGGTGADILAGGTGDDTFLIDGTDTAYDRFEGDAGYDVIQGGTGNDTIRINTYTGNYTVEKIDGGAGINTLAGSSYSDTLDFSTTELLNINAIDGGVGNDSITGSATNDVIIGGTGADILAGGAGDDTFLMDGTDTAYDRFEGDAGYDVIQGGTGNDTIRINTYTGNYTVEKIDGGVGINTLAGSSYSDTLDFSTTELLNINAIDSGVGNDSITGSSGNDVIIGGEGADVLTGGLGQDQYDLTETTAATDTLKIATGDSLISHYDTAYHFTLGSGTSTIGTDKLDLNSTLIATDATSVDGIDSGNLLSHSIKNGIISFSNTNNAATAITLSNSDLPNIFNYLQTNITGNKTVALTCEGNTFLFQDGGATDTLIELMGVTATGINTTGLTSGSLWIV